MIKPCDALPVAFTFALASSAVAQYPWLAKLTKGLAQFLHHLYHESIFVSLLGRRRILLRQSEWDKLFCRREPALEIGQNFGDADVKVLSGRGASPALACLRFRPLRVSAAAQIVLAKLRADP